LISVMSGDCLQCAVDRANIGDVIEVEGGIYPESIDLNKPLSLIAEKSSGDLPQVQSITITADFCSVSGFRVSCPGGFGISVLSDYNNITHNWVEACAGGIVLKNCQGNLVSGNNATIVCQGFMGFPQGDGIHLMNSHNNTIEKNTASKGFIGIYLDSSNFNRVLSNQVFENANGIGLLTSEGNRIHNNTANNNQDEGIGVLKFSNGNTISENTLEENGDYGIYLQDSSSNTLCLNNLINNQKNAGSRVRRSEKATNQWHCADPRTDLLDGKTTERYLGNYWSDYGGLDSNGDGIGDSSHSIEGGQDDYPLIRPWTAQARLEAS